MERQAVRNVEALAWQLRAFVEKWPEPRTAEQVIEQVAASGAQAKRPKSIAVIPVSGALETRPTEIGAWMGMSSYEVIGKVFDHFVGDETVSGIILDVSSPGGMVYGAQELADKIFQARGTKPIIAVANPMAASGAFWIGAAADRMVVTPSGDVGSVGVITEHVDVSRLYEGKGVTVSTFKSAVSPYKGEYSDAAPLTEEAKQHLQSRVDAISHTFVGDLAKFRGVSAAHVGEHFGKGRLVDSKAALHAGMVDRVGTLQEIAYKMAAGRIRIAGERAQDNWDAPTRQEQLQQRVAAIHAAVKESQTKEKL
jgi:signal peptide peptidase SppA